MPGTEGWCPGTVLSQGAPGRNSSCFVLTTWQHQQLPSPCHPPKTVDSTLSPLLFTRKIKLVNNSKPLACKILVLLPASFAGRDSSTASIFVMDGWLRGRNNVPQYSRRDLHGQGAEQSYWAAEFPHES